MRGQLQGTIKLASLGLRPLDQGCASPPCIRAMGNRVLIAILRHLEPTAGTVVRIDSSTPQSEILPVHGGYFSNISAIRFAYFLAAFSGLCEVDPIAVPCQTT